MASFGDLNRVNTNVQSLDAQLSLNRINRDLADSSLRMSTGLKINRAEDNAAGYSIATKLRSRISGLDQALQNVGDAKSVLDIAESSFDSIMDSLVEMKGLASRAANDTLGATERGYVGSQIAALGKDINEIANQTVYQDYELLNGLGGNHEGDLQMTFQVGERAEDTITTNLEAVNVNMLFAESSAANNYGTAAVTGASIGGQVNGSTTSSVAQITITNAGGTVASITGLSIDTSVIDADSMQAVADQINALGVAGLTATVNETGDGLDISNANSEAHTVTFTGDFDANGTATDTHAASLAAATQNAAGQGEMDLADWSTDQYRAFIGDIDHAIDVMSDRVNNIGITQSSLSVREETLSRSISANESAKSRIMDTDFAREQSNSIRLQILQQTATSSLAQANMGPQSVLGFIV